MERYLGLTLQILLVTLKLQDRALSLPPQRGGAKAFIVLVIKTYCPAVSGASVSSCAYTCYVARWPKESGVSYRYL